MKYNGKEVTEEFVALVVKRIWNKCMPLVDEAQAKSVLEAAEEVFAETQPKTELNSELERIIANLDAAQQEYNPHIDRIIAELTELKEAQS